ncbi:MAG: zinc-dependent metalloprotease [Candidatus Cloacimonetes bacterium]|nr:zinc-dependent metalloprotease [Candidatus Cloacimonadota bacterium]
MKAKGLITFLFLFYFTIALFGQIINNELLLIEESGLVMTTQQIEPLSFYDNRSSVTRYQEVSLPIELTTPSEIVVGDRLVLNLFNEINYPAVIDHLELNRLGTFTVRARIEDCQMGYIIISTTEDRSLAIIYIPERNEYFTIISDPVTLSHYLLEINLAEADELVTAPPVTPPPLQESSRHEQERIRRSLEEVILTDPATIDVMVVYTPAAANWANTSGGGIYNVINGAMQNGQISLDNSNTLMSVDLVYAAEVDYQESGSASIDLIRLAASPDFNPWGDYVNGYYIPGYLDEVHIWRDIYGADLVALFALVDDVGGVGFLLQDRWGYPEIGFSLTRVQQASWTYTHVHEMGHNMGLHHHAEQNFQPGPTEWFNWSENTWSAGWRWTGNNNQRYCSVMTYTSGSYFPDGLDHARVAHFSNPLINYEGVPTGHATLGDNARTLRELRHIIAAYRPSMMIEIDTPIVSVEIIDGYIHLNWEAVSGSNSYKIYATDNPYQEDWGNEIAIVGSPGYVEIISEERKFYRVIASTEEAPVFDLIPDNTLSGDR